MRHGDLLVAQTPSREIWFAGASSPRRTSAGKTVSRNPPWFLQPGWQTAPQTEARSLLMSLYSTARVYRGEAPEPIGSVFMTHIFGLEAYCGLSSLHKTVNRSMHSIPILITNNQRTNVVPIPKYDEIMLPLLKVLNDGQSHTSRELSEKMADHFRLTREERQQMLPSGRVTRIKHRTGWAAFGLRKAGLATNPVEGTLKITDETPGLLNPMPRFDSSLGFSR
jgi:hypothetical protein